MMKFLVLLALAVSLSGGHPKRNNRKWEPKLWAVPEVRSIHIRWFDNTGVPLSLRVCEIPGRCHTRPLPGGIKEARITGLRMLGNYSLSLRRSSGRLAHTTFVTTLAYTATVPKCSLKYTEVKIMTGPYFGGKIAVEDSTNPHCMLRGNRSLIKPFYSLTVPHGLCDSVKKQNQIETIIVVHENPDIITHNSRRFLVKCNLFPETFTVQASINMPLFDHDLNRNEVFSLETHQDNNVRDSRILAEPKSAMHKIPVARSFSFLGHIPVFIAAFGFLFCAIGLLACWKRSQYTEPIRQYAAVHIPAYPPLSLTAVRAVSEI